MWTSFGVDVEGRAAAELEEDEPPAAEASEGNAAEEGALMLVGGAAQPGGPRWAVTGAGPPRRVLFLSLSTLVECCWEGAALGTAGLEDEAVAQPLELDVAPCMPLRPGRLG